MTNHFMERGNKKNRKIYFSRYNERRANNVRNIEQCFRSDRVADTSTAKDFQKVGHTFARSDTKKGENSSQIKGGLHNSLHQRRKKRTL